MKIEIVALEEIMMKKVIKFFDHHRLLLVLLILLFIVLLFLTINSYLFLHYDFNALNCTKEIDEEYCYYKEKKIFVNPEQSKKAFFYKQADIIEELQKNYHLDDFNFYTAYYYFVASKLQYEINGEYKILQDFFKTYVDTYNLEDFYINNNFYFNLFYRYKIY